MTKQSYIFLAHGVDELEATTTITVLRRAQIPVVSVAVSDILNVKGATGQTLVADVLITDVDTSEADWLILPGGDPGAWNLYKNQEVKDILTAHFEKGGRFAAICAAPAIVLARLGVLKGKRATCYPGLGKLIEKRGGTYVRQGVVVESGLITTEAPGTTLSFAIEIIRVTKGDKVADDLAASMLIK
ncbi:MAG: DJ-1/PfpI family protein [Muribaculaceae bacterium]|nr:DJ-1/PfpI family protein [Muribaculaceae bacterium]